MRLFQPNNLSRPRAEFTRVADDQLIAEVSALLNQYNVSTQNPELSTASGANVTSQNLRVQVAGESYFLKRRSLEHLDKIEQEVRLTEKLAANGARVPKIIPNNGNSLVSTSGASCYVLYEFTEGDYFTGKGNELAAAAEAFAELTRIAANFTPSSPLDSSLLDQVSDLVTRQASLTPHLDTINRHLEQVLDQRAHIEAVIVPIHLDFHPLNLLMKDEQVECVLDFEHLKPYPLMAGVGFAGYKLIRQTLTTEKREPRALVKQWLETWSRNFPDSPVSPSEFCSGASYRVLYLIAFILDSMSQGDDRFNYDLEKQLISLYEIDALA